MLNGLLKLATAALIAVGIVAFVTKGDLTQVTEAAKSAYSQAMDRKRERIAAQSTPPKPPETGTKRVEVVVRDSRAKPLTSSLTMTGATEASRQVAVRAETSGIVALAPRKGERVRAGDLLCRMELGDRRARRAASVARLNQALTEERAQQRLSEKGYASANAASARRADAEVLRAEIAQIDIDIRRLEITAPFDGIVEQAPVELGGLLQIGGTCAELIDPDPLRISGYAPEFEIGKLQLGGPATARLATGESVRGAIAFIAQSADPATRTFEVEVEVANPDYRLRDAVTAEIEIPTRSREAHRLPQSALTLNAEGEIGVMVDEGGTARFRAVEVLRDGSDGVWVGGLDARSRVIVIGQEFVSDGTPIDATLQTDDILGSGA